MSAPAFTPEQIKEVLAQIVDACGTMIHVCNMSIENPGELGPAAECDLAAVTRMAFRQIGMLADGLNGFDCRGTPTEWFVDFDMPDNVVTLGDAA